MDQGRHRGRTGHGVRQPHSKRDLRALARTPQEQGQRNDGNGGIANAGNLYFVLGTLSGTSPGVVAGTFIIPINQDFYTNLTLFTPNTPPLLNNMNVLDANGTATATLALPPLGSGVVGLMAHHVGLVFDATGIALVSNPYPVVITP